MRVTVAAPAKINLWLQVGAPEPSGFHPLDTLFSALQLADSVVLQPGDGREPELEMAFAPPLDRAPDLGPSDENLAYRAAMAFMERAGLRTAPQIRLVKRIPAGGGLGGGSSDAAAVLRGMTRLHSGVLDSAQLLDLAAELGSDVPFFMMGRPLALGRGRGERLTALRPLPSRPVVLVLADRPVSTSDAFRWLDDDRPDIPELPEREEPLGSLDWDQVETAARNDFEGPVFQRHSELAGIRDALEAAGARIALLSGSGSTVFGVFDGEKAATTAARQLRDRGSDTVVVTRTRTR